MRDAHEQGVLAAVLLAGGASQRAGVDKRYLVLEGQTLLQRNLTFLHGLFPTVAVSLRREQEVDLGDATADMLLRDAWPGASPLAGIATALARFQRPLFVMAVDIAFPDPVAVARLLAAFPGHDLALPAVGHHHEPLFAVYGPACLGPMTALLEAGRHRIVEIIPSLDVARVPFSDGSAFHNINTREAYETAQRAAGAARGLRAPEGAPAPATAPAARPAVVAVVGKSDAGKTTLIEGLVPELVKLGLRVGTVKHDAHSFEIDHPGKDSWRHGQTGARAYAIASPDRLAYIARLDRELPLTRIAEMYFPDFDLVVAEGYKNSAPHRIEVFRAGAGHQTPLCGPGETLALVTDAPLPHERRFALDDAQGLARFVVARLDSLRRF
jgi:molybdopterin-guanine dinucleotide biosynthesis protein B/molybdopterin-guanine dinucleotide biosynthesis protein